MSDPLRSLYHRVPPADFSSVRLYNSATRERPIAAYRLVPQLATHLLLVSDVSRCLSYRSLHGARIFNDVQFVRPRASTEHSLKLLRMRQAARLYTSDNLLWHTCYTPRVQA